LFCRLKEGFSILGIELGLAQKGFLQLQPSRIGIMALKAKFPFSAQFGAIFRVLLGNAIGQIEVFEQAGA
jgi:hypothetical protein